MYIFCFLPIEVPAVVVGVVGMGHVPGIERNWEKELNIQEIMTYVFLPVTKNSCHGTERTFLFLLYLSSSVWHHPHNSAGCYAPS